jgi:hypothetical protein
VAPARAAAAKKGGGGGGGEKRAKAEKGAGAAAASAPVLRARAAPRSAQFGQESLPDDYDDLEEELDDAPEGALRAAPCPHSRAPLFGANPSC